MNFSQYAGIAIVPTLSRLVLAATFLFAGYSKLFTKAEFEATADGKGPANRLHAWDVSVAPKSPPPAPTASTAAQWLVVRASYRQETPSNEPVPGSPTTSDNKPPPDSTPAPEAATTQALPQVTLAPGTYVAPTLYTLAIMLDDNGWRFPVLLAWLASLSEFIGGGMLLIGLFSRIWGLALAAVMGVAFYLTSLPALQSAPSVLDLGHMQSSTLFLQCALFVLALGIALTGAGPLSLDRLLFTRSAPPDLDKPAAEPRRPVVRV